MSDLVTIWTFAYQHHLLTIRARLDAEGIETFTQNELTIQVDPLFSNALGGIKLLVHAEDAERATAILAEEGLVAKKEKTASDFLQSFDNRTRDLGLIGGLQAEHRFFVLVTVAVLLVALVFYLISIS